ncbi:MAG: lactate racemase domain-containing protein [Kofleriaceae bacterium]
MVVLPYGRVPYQVDLRGRPATLVEAAPRPPPAALNELLDGALDAPIGRPALDQLISPGARITVIVSDRTRAEPRSAFLEALARRIPTDRWTLAIATGTHGPSPIDDLGLPPAIARGARIVNHDGHRDEDLVEIGTTAHGTVVRVHRCVVETDLVIATGCIRPHYFAGFGAGVKAIFPGLGAASSIRHNHRLKTATLSRAGIVDGNPCRADLEEAASFVRAPTFLLDGVLAPDDQIHAAVAGDPVAAFRAGSQLARAWFTVRAPRSSLVIASDAPPITASLYQAAKIAAAVAPLIDEGGALVIAAECPDGIEPREVVNEAIFRIGVLPRLAPGASLHLLSSLPDDLVRTTLLEPIGSLDHLLQAARDPVTVVPRASQLILEALS